MFFNYQFLCNQSRFGWDNKKFTVMADSKAWEELIQAHPPKNFGKLRDKPFPIYKLAKQVFTATFPTGKISN